LEIDETGVIHIAKRLKMRDFLTAAISAVMLDGPETVRGQHFKCRNHDSAGDRSTRRTRCQGEGFFKSSLEFDEILGALRSGPRMGSHFRARAGGKADSSPSFHSGSESQH
jgi:hypothetical protein